MKTAFPLNSTPVSIRLYSNIPFDNTYKHHSLISDLFTYNNSFIYHGTLATGIAKERFINRKTILEVGHPSTDYYPRYNLTGEFNFDFSNGLIGSVVLELTPQQTNANYMRVQAGDSTSGYEYYYYFITGITQINADTYRLSLELDVLMTYQDEFLEGMKDVPVFTQRKHCHRYTFDGLMPHCADFKTGDSAFSNIKTSYIEGRENIIYSSQELRKIKDVMWLYCCVDTEFLYEGNNENIKTRYKYRFSNVQHPLSMICLPINVNSLNFTGTFMDGPTIREINWLFNKSDIDGIVKSLINNGKVHGCKLSPYPPFNIGDATVGKVGDDYSITSTTMYVSVPYSMGISFKSSKSLISLLTPESGSISYKTIVIFEEYPDEFDLELSNELPIKNSSEPTINDYRYQDPKLLFSPFTKYTLSAPYGEEYEIYPELAFSDGLFNDANLYFGSISTCYIGDNNIFTYIKPRLDRNYRYFFNNYKPLNLGISTNVNYNLPAGTNALDVFNATQAQSFYTSKVASGITSGLSVAGGIASIVIGSGMTIGSSGALSPMGIGMVAGGVGAIASGTAGVANTIKSTNAKIEDLKNTPNSVNVQGSCFTNDISRDELLPKINMSVVSDVIKENANDYFYNYGYEVARECYFNTEMYWVNDNHSMDNNLFGRTIFNYIQTNDDITNKINYNMPLIIKQKINSIFNNGITLWSFFGLGGLWGYDDIPNTNNFPDKWFMKCILDNTEYKQ